MIKSLSLLTRKSELTHEQFVRHWVDVHAPLAHAVPGLRRYVQSHIVEERTRADIPATDVAIDGIAELWYDDGEAMARALASPEAKALHADGALFIGRIKTYTIDEKEIVPGRPELIRAEEARETCEPTRTASRVTVLARLATERPEQRDTRR